jgi:pilus assembly protein Flp/PilA
MPYRMHKRPSPPTHPLRALRRLLRDTGGATAVEYGLIAAVIVIALLASFAGVAEVTKGMWNNINTKVTQAH